MTEKKDEKKEDISYMVGCANVCIWWIQEVTNITKQNKNYLQKII
jgi:hypothetical protein